jgi:hypothetical protein
MVVVEGYGRIVELGVARGLAGECFVGSNCRGGDEAHLAVGLFRSAIYGLVVLKVRYVLPLQQTR